jgi:PhnB protein
MAAKPIPEGFHTVTPYLVVEGADKLIDFVKAAFGAKEVVRHKGPGGMTMHAEVTIGDSHVMIGQASERAKPTPAMLYLYVTDVDATYNQAVQAGGKSIMEPVNMFYGDRSGAVSDPFGIQWWIATHIEDVSEEEMARRMQAQSK